jgi:hypothetical protein
MVAVTPTKGTAHMCWMCDNPGSTIEDYLGVLRSQIITRGWTVQYVEDNRTPYAYTIGLHDLRRPELLVTGVSSQRATRMLKSVARICLCDGAPEPGARIQLPAGPLLEIVKIDHPDAHMDMAVAFNGIEFQALQLVWADGRGRWPWSASFSDGRGRQPVLGVRAAPD